MIKFIIAQPKLLILAFIFVPLLGLAQPAEQELFYFRKHQDKVSQEALANVVTKDHYLGDQIAKKLAILRESYVWVEDANALRPTPTTHIEKPSIYNSVKKVDRYYKKAIKSGYLSKSEASSQFENILDICISIRYQSTDTFEEKLSEIKDEKQIVTVYTEMVSLSL